MNNKRNIEEVFQKLNMSDLSDSEKNRVWHSIDGRLNKLQTSQVWLLALIKKPMGIAIAIILALTVGAGGTAALADNAGPGDILFPVDRAVENIRLALSSGERKDNLRVRFAEERFEEVEEIRIKVKDSGREEGSLSAEEQANIALGVQIATRLLGNTSASSSAQFQAETDALIQKLNENIQSLPENFRVEIRTDDSRSRLELKDGEIRLKIKTEDSDDRSDNDSDDDSRSSSGNLEVEADIFTDITTVKVEINDRKTEFTTNARTREAVISEILTRFPELSRERVEAVLDLEVEDRASRPDDISDNDNDDEDDDSDDDQSDSDNSSSSSLEIEADVFTDITIVEVELNDKKTQFQTSARTRTLIISEILLRFPTLTALQIESALDLEVEDRASRSDDRNDDSDDDSDDDDNSGRR